MLRPLQKLLLAASFCALPFTAARAFDFSITVAPPLLPVYEQPPCPEDGYLWTPGYWDYADAGYFWVPGVWVEPPRIGFLWTPGFWGFDDGLYVFHTGYWGSRVGFYGGVNYGYGYNGFGYGGGRWEGDRFRYNTAVTRVNTTVIRNVYVDRSVGGGRGSGGRTSFNGPGGISVRPNAEQRQAMNAPHLSATSAQVSRREEASRDRGQFAAANHGRPAMTAAGQGQSRERGVNARSERQAARGANGVSQGQLTGRQGRQLEAREGGLQRRTNAERGGNRRDGLLPEERQLAGRRENRAGRQIYDKRQAGSGRVYPQAGSIGRVGADGRVESAQAYGRERRAEAQQMRRAQGQRQAQGQPREGGRREARQQAQGHSQGQHAEQPKGKHDDRRDHQ